MPAVRGQPGLAELQPGHGQQVGEERGDRRIGREIDLVLAEGTDDRNSHELVLGWVHVVFALRGLLVAVLVSDRGLVTMVLSWLVA